MSELQLRRRTLAGLVALVAAVVYANSLANRFAYDDVAILDKDVRVHGLGHLAAILTGPYWAAYDKGIGNYRPLTTLGFALQWTLGGGAPWVFHLGNIVLHVAVCVLLFLLLAHFAGRAGAFLGAVLFAVHPLHTEAVANVVGQSELLAAVFVLAAALLWLRRDPAAPARPGTIAGVAGAYALALFSKESAVIAPALLVALDLADRRITSSWSGWRAYTRSVAPLFAVLGLVAAGYLAARFAVLASIPGLDVVPSMPFLVEHHVWMGLRVWPEYARLLVLPLDLSADYSPAVILPVHGWTYETALGAALLLGTCLLALLTPWRPRVGLPAAWFLLSILIVSNLFFPIGVLLGERTLYLPSAALALAAAFAWTPLSRRYTPRLLIPVIAVGLLGLGARTWRRNPEWRDQETVFRAMLRDHPESGRAQWFAADQLNKHGDLRAADDAFALAYRLWPDNRTLVLEYGAFLLTRGQHERALEPLRRAVAVQPSDSVGRHLLATTFVLLGRNREALALADSVAPRHGIDPVLEEVRARAHMGLGEFPAAVLAWRRALSVYPATWVQWSAFAQSLAATGDYPGALAAIDSARSRALTDSAALRRLDAVRLQLREAAAADGRRPPTTARGES